MDETSAFRLTVTGRISTVSNTCQYKIYSSHPVCIQYSSCLARYYKLS